MTLLLRTLSIDITCAPRHEGIQGTKKPEILPLMLCNPTRLEKTKNTVVCAHAPQVISTKKNLYHTL